ncbi:hypothetical protein PAPYR_498 [Paratrimastix pyriformis]|uniref:G-protein coupled receptors family 2 profile 2 domain-containing protein n=1 Tax=Paratrimastix pyriformis TaxID=342808 RepID=A0ABQ8UWN5_9EUKA|nr:hypothetical protein PAPYR_498 [Paratrimastix pyriformis]
MSHTVIPTTFSLLEDDIVNGCLVTSASLSCLGTFSMIVFTLANRDFRLFHHWLVFFLSVFELIAAVGWALSGSAHFADLSANAPTCQVGGILIEVGHICAFCWVLLMSVNTLLLAYRVKTQPQPKSLILGVYLPITFLFAAPFVILSLVYGMYGRAGLWCWISSEWNGFRFYFFFIPLWVIVIAISVLFTFVGVRMHSLGKSSHNKNMGISDRNKRLIRQMVTYVAIFATTWIFGTINRIQNSVAPKPVFVITLLHSIFSPMSGFLNSMYYMKIEGVFARCFCPRPKAHQAVAQVEMSPNAIRLVPPRPTPELIDEGEEDLHSAV